MQTGTGTHIFYNNYELIHSTTQSFDYISDNIILIDEETETEATITDYTSNDAIKAIFESIQEHIKEYTPDFWSISAYMEATANSNNLYFTIGRP